MDKHPQRNDAVISNVIYYIIPEGSLSTEESQQCMLLLLRQWPVVPGTYFVPTRQVLCLLTSFGKVSYYVLSFYRCLTRIKALYTLQISKHSLQGWYKQWTRGPGTRRPRTRGDLLVATNSWNNIHFSTLMHSVLQFTTYHRQSWPAALKSPPRLPLPVCLDG